MIFAVEISGNWLDLHTLILLTGLSGMFSGWMKESFRRITKIVTTSLLMMDFSPRYVVDKLAGVLNYVNGHFPYFGLFEK